MDKKKLLRRRIYAFTIDLLCIAFIQKSILSTFLTFSKQLNFFHHSLFTSQMITPLDTLILTIIVISYFTLNYYLFNGKSIGKYLCKLQVISREHKEFTFWDSFTRANGYFFCLLAMNVLFLIPFMNKKAEGIPDWLSNSFVENWDDTCVANSVIPPQLEILPAREQIIPLPNHQQKDSDYSQAA